PWLALGPARIIVNQVSSSDPSHLRGYVEVAGQRAEVVIANPNGILVDGAGFINASKVTLTTGVPQYGAFGGLDAFAVRGGVIRIDGAGLDLSRTDYAAILSRALQVNAAIYANDLKVVTGAGQVSADAAQVTTMPASSGATAPGFALDVAQLGGMYANKIVLVGTEAGLGMRNAGSIGAGAGGLVVTAAGRLENTGTLEGARVQLASAADIDNRGGTIRQGSLAALTIAAPTLSNTDGGWIGMQPVSTSSGSGETGGTGPSPGTAAPGGSTDPATPSGGAEPATGGGSTPAPAAPPQPGAINAAGAILNDGGKIYAGGPITLQSPNIINTGGTLSVANMALNQQSFSNHGGALNVSGSFSANVQSFDNSTGTLRAGSLNIATTGDLINTDGTLTSDSDATLSVGGKVDNTRGTIAANGALSATVAGDTHNTSGTLAANQQLQLAAAGLTNDKGSLQSAAGSVQLDVSGALNNGQGNIAAGADLRIQAGSVANLAGGSLRAAQDVQVTSSGQVLNAGSITAGRHTSVDAGSVQATTGSVLGAGIQADGSLAAAGDLNVVASQRLGAQGTSLAAGNATLQGASVDVSGSSTNAANLSLTATSGNVTTEGAKVVTPGTLRIAANSNAGQTLMNDAGTLNAGQLQISASNIANTNGGEIVQTGTAATTIAVTGSLNNDGGRIASNSQDLTLSGASITNTGGKIEHAGPGALAIRGGSFDGRKGQITGNGALGVDLSGGFAQDGGVTTAQQITIDAAALSNRGGEIIQTGTQATRITVVGAADNTGGSIASNGPMNVAAGSLTNHGGKLRTTGTSSLVISTTDALDN
ncbi:filamentous hemagglutinin N-terminal domain-containing protein, partial [Xenophilus arseniciresistens]